MSKNIRCYNRLTCAAIQRKLASSSAFYAMSLDHNFIRAHQMQHHASSARKIQSGVLDLMEARTLNVCAKKASGAHLSTSLSMHSILWLWQVANNETRAPL